MTTEARKELIEHYSSEVNTLIESAMSFRSRAAFTVWVAPYLLLGAYMVANKDGVIVLNPAAALSSYWLWILIVCYFSLGVLAGTLEGYLWQRIDSLNTAISVLSGVKGGPEQVLVSQKLFKSQVAYIFVFAALILSFVAVLNLTPLVIKSQSGTPSEVTSTPEQSTKP